MIEGNSNGYSFNNQHGPALGPTSFNHLPVTSVS